MPHDFRNFATSQLRNFATSQLRNIAKTIFVITIISTTNCYAFNLWGYTPESGISYCPVGFHWEDYLEGENQPNDLNHVVSLNYKSLVVGTFIDSYQNDLKRIYLIAFERDLTNKKIRFGYSLGLVDGYHGKLAQGEFKNNPFMKTLMGGDINPWAYFTLKYLLTKHIAIVSMVTINYSTIGLKIIF